MAQIVYEGKWFTPLREAVQAFVEKTQEYVTGEVKFKLYKGNIIKAGTTSPYSLYNESIASFTTGDLYDHHECGRFHQPVRPLLQGARDENAGNGKEFRAALKRCDNRTTANSASLWRRDFRGVGTELYPTLTKMSEKFCIWMSFSFYPFMV